jgi:glucan phosphoethanolaminetransferase (alkaline phosphatase superfamily)
MMKKTQFYGIWVYGVLCLVLILLYRYYTDVFGAKIYDYNLSLWSALAVNLILLASSIASSRGSKVLLILGIILAPVSTYLFYESWTKINYEYLAGFAGIPILLLLVATFMKNAKPIIGTKTA